MSARSSSRALGYLAGSILVVLVAVIALTGAPSPSGAAQESTPMAGMAGMDLPVGNVGLTSVVLAQIEPPVAPGQLLQLVRVDVESGATVSEHTHPGAIVTCVESGAPIFSVIAGTVTMTQAATAATPEAATELGAGSEIELQPGDCLTFDATQTTHTLRNPGESVVIWQAHLYAAGEKPTTFLGTPES